IDYCSVDTEGSEMSILAELTDRGSDFCGNPERHEYELYLAVEDIDHSRTKTKSPQTNGTSTRPRSTNFTASPSAKRCIVQSMSCRRTWTCGSENTMSKGRIRDAGASAKPRCRPSWMRCRWRRRKRSRPNGNRHQNLIAHQASPVRSSCG